MDPTQAEEFAYSYAPTLSIEGPSCQVAFSIPAAGNLTPVARDRVKPRWLDGVARAVASVGDDSARDPPGA